MREKQESNKMFFFYCTHNRSIHTAIASKSRMSDNKILALRCNSLDLLATTRVTT